MNLHSQVVDGYSAHLVVPILDFLVVVPVRRVFVVPGVGHVLSHEGIVLITSDHPVLVVTLRALIGPSEKKKPNYGLNNRVVKLQLLVSFVNESPLGHSSELFIPLNFIHVLCGRLSSTPAPILLALCHPAPVVIVKSNNQVFVHLRRRACTKCTY